MAQQDSQEQGILHDRLKDQITISIKESLDKATMVLSSLHRVHSYLDVLKSMPSFRSGSGSEGLKGALEQVRSIRTDAAALLQTIYLTEIGLQSLQDVDKQAPSVCATTSEVTILPILGDSINSSSLSEPAINSNQDEVVEGRAVIELTRRQESTAVHPETTEDMTPPAKKLNMGVIITNCTSCNRKFATNQVDFQLGGKCKICRSTGTPLTGLTQSNVPTPVIKSLSMPSGTSHSVLSSVLSSTPLKSTAGSKSKVRKISNPPISCKVCGICFVYRRCLFRHLRENHPGIDLNNIHDYIETEKAEEVPVDEESPAAPGSQNTSMNVTVGSENVPSDIDESAISDQPPLGQVLEDGDADGGQDKIVLGDADKRIYTCSVCNKVFDRPYRLTRHLQIHDPNRPRVTCQVCDRSFTRLDTLENHMKSMHSDERPYRCQYSSCEKSFATQSALINHLKVHTDGKPYKCLECDSSFTLLLEYKQHVRQAHANTENLRCSDCYRVFSDTENLERHRAVEHRLECEICGKSFARLAYLQLHVQVHSGERIYNCKFCSQGFDSEYAYKQHMKTHPENQRSKKGFHCQLCDKSFEEPSNLIAHYRSQEHRDKATSLGIGADTTILNTIEGDLSDMNALVDEVAMGTNPVPMATDAMETKPITVEANPVALRITEDEETKMISSIAENTSFEA